MNSFLELTINATNAIHEYQKTILKGVDISGKRMNAAPTFWGNTQLQFNWSNHLNSSIEWQHQSSYFHGRNQSKQNILVLMCLILEPTIQ